MSRGAVPPANLQRHLPARVSTCALDQLAADLGISVTPVRRRC